MNKKIFAAVIISFILISCSVKTVKDYYVLSYLPEPDELARFNLAFLPIDAKVEVQNFEMNRIYDRNSIVVRESLHKLSFDTKNNWALRPDRALPELIAYHVNAAGIFKECKTDFISVTPDYYITGIINNIEIHRSGAIVQAHLNARIELRDRDRNVLVVHFIDEKKDIGKYDPAFFVKTLGDILNGGVQQFLIKTVDYFSRNK